MASGIQNWLNIYAEKKGNPSDEGENPMGSPNGDMLRDPLSNSLSLLKVQLECSTPYLLLQLNRTPVSEEINPLLRIYCVFSAGWEIAFLERKKWIGEKDLP